MFLDVKLPDDVEKGATGGPGFSTNVVSLANGAEKSNEQWKNSRGKYSISYGTDDQFDRIIDLFFVVRGKAHTFRFRDWADFEFVDDVQFIGDGVKNTFQLVRSYTFGDYEFVRPIFLPIADTLVIMVGGIVRTYTLGAFGFITLSGAVPGVGVAVTAIGEFDVMVRFDTDDLAINVQQWRAAGVNSLNLIEKRP